jgi:carotenoid cleavage dioxygenase-like enzyme
MRSLLVLLASTVAALQGSPPLPKHLQAIERDLRKAHTPMLNKEMNALFEAIPDEIGPMSAKIVAGAIPHDLKNGALLRNGPNARRWGSKGGWLDGDGMVHAVVLNDEPRYSRRWLRTEAFAKEEAVGKELFDGSLVAPFGFKLLANLGKNLVRAKQPQKDTANTALLALKRGNDSEQKNELELVDAVASMASTKELRDGVVHAQVASSD